MWRMAMAAVLGFAGPALAHPHVFIDTSVSAILDAEGRLTGVRLRWDYDALVSMVVAEDKSADADMDGTISAAEAAALDGFDMTWVEGFDGDTFLYQDEVLVPLVPGPQDWVTGWETDDAGGHLWSEHTRRLVAPVDPGAGPVSIVVFDVSDYTAYSLTVAALAPGEAEGLASPCRIEPPLAQDAAADSEPGGGILSTIGLFVFGQGEPAAVPVVPSLAKGRVVAVLNCG
jgi:Protein of unknown function (DUF1007)